MRVQEYFLQEFGYEEPVEEDIKMEESKLPIFGKDIVDDWSFDKAEEAMREEHDED